MTVDGLSCARKHFWAHSAKRPRSEGAFANASKSAEGGIGPEMIWPCASNRITVRRVTLPYFSRAGRQASTLKGDVSTRGAPIPGQDCLGMGEICDDVPAHARGDRNTP